MKTSTKNTIKSVSVLLVIALVCVALLSLANVLLKTEITLDYATVQKLNELCPTGVDDQTALDEDYFVLVSDDELKNGANDYKVKDYKNNANNKLVAVYLAVKGESAGAYILETTGSGQYALSIYTAFTLTSDGFAITAVSAKSETEDENYKQVFNPEYFERFIDLVVGNNQPVSDKEIMTATGATTKNSARGLSQALSVAIRAMDGLYKYDDTLRAEIAKRSEGGEVNE